MNTKQIMIVAGPESRINEFPLWSGLSNTYIITFADTDERAIEMAHSKHFDLVIADETDMEINVKKLSAVLPVLQAETEMITYNGGSFAELNQNIRQHFITKRNERIMRFLVLDSSGSHAAWNDFPAFSAN